MFVTHVQFLLLPPPILPAPSTPRNENASPIDCLMDKDKFLKGLVEGLMFVSQGLKLSDKLFKSLSLLEVINK